MLVKAAAYSVHALDKLYSILCTFKFKFLTNSKKKWYDYAGEQNLYFIGVNFINAHKNVPVDEILDRKSEVLVS